MATITIRAASVADTALLLALIRALAEYEKLAHECVAGEDSLREHLFGARPYAEAIIAEADGEPAGFALFFHNYSTFVGKPGIYLEDLFVQPAFRGLGIGKRLLAEVARIGVERGCGRYEWTVLDWNEPAIRFYQSLGAEMKREWIINRVSGAALNRLAQLAGPR
ncbi:GNAT family N-acetyltransferase [Solimonas variicoloris]|uniref:GNAT family N-acetyltransferase n=1 Tax=Solimonas variicoloris TaxID=254408 RepID=UPI00036D3F9D|nr:GNAT family N-acetyltransferase [Solimonas variicoloris]